jgi:hypothetical protein
VKNATKTTLHARQNIFECHSRKILFDAIAAQHESEGAEGGEKPVGKMGPISSVRKEMRRRAVPPAWGIYA